MPIFIPPGGFQGFAQQTPATQALLRGPRGNAGGTRRKAVGSRVRRKKKTGSKRRTAAKSRRGSTVRKARRATGRGKPLRLVKGSAAAKRHMAKLRKMRRR